MSNAFFVTTDKVTLIFVQAVAAHRHPLILFPYFSDRPPFHINSECWLPCCLPDLRYALVKTQRHLMSDLTR